MDSPMFRRHLRSLAIASALFTAVTSCIAQQPAKSFEVTSVRQNRSGLEHDNGVDIHGARITGTNLSLRTLILEAYGVLDFQIVGGPDWLSSARFDIQATTAGGQPISGAALGPMLQRFVPTAFIS